MSDVIVDVTTATYSLCLDMAGAAITLGASVVLPRRVGIPVPPEGQVMTAELPIHPAADLLPAMKSDEFAGFVEDIKQHGLRELLALVKQCHLLRRSGINAHPLTKRQATALIDLIVKNGLNPSADVTAKAALWGAILR